MAELVDGFVALPGGLGTLEETFEMLTLGPARHPRASRSASLNVAGYWDDLIRFLAHTVREGFLRPEYLGLIQFASTPASLLDGLAAWQPPPFRGSGSGRPRPSSAARTYAARPQTLADGVIHSYPQLDLRRADPVTTRSDGPNVTNDRTISGNPQGLPRVPGPGQEVVERAGVEHLLGVRARRGGRSRCRARGGPAPAGSGCRC